MTKICGEDFTTDDVPEGIDLKGTGSEKMVAAAMNGSMGSA